MLLYGAAIHWLSSNRRTGSPATASLQSTHEQIAVDNGELNSSSSTRAAAAASATASEFSSSKQQQQARQAASPAGTDTTLLASSSSSSSHFLGVNGSENKKKRSEELEQETSISLSSDDTLGVTTGKTKTPNGGHCHTPESRGKISAANKGKTPWNKGGNHSEETRRKIAEGAREAARRRKVAMATAMGLSVEEYEKVKRRERNTRTEPGEGTTQETRSKISARLRERWKDPVYRQARLSTMPKRQGVKHSEETKQRIRQAVTLKWNDPEYREKITSRVSTEETRKKIGQVIRDQWADPNIRKERMANMSPKSEEHRKRIAASVKAKWADPDYRARTVERMKASSQARTIATGKVPKPKRIPQPRVPRPPRPPREPRAKRSPRSTMAKWTVMGRKVEAQLERENKRAEKMKAAEEKLKAKQAKLEAERLAKEEEDRLVAGMDELDALLYRQNLRVQAHSQQAEESADTVGDEEVEWGEEEEYYDPDDEYELLARPKRRSRAKKTATPGEGEEVEGVDVPEGFKMVMQNGRMVLRMR